MKRAAVAFLLAPAFAFADGGEPPPKRSAASVRHGRAACDAGDDAECVRLGEHLVTAYYSFDGGRARDAADALALFNKACARNDAAGCRQVGWMYYEGLAVAKDWTRARELFRRACDAGDGGGCDLLGDSLEDRHDAHALSMEAFALYQRACAGKTDGLGCISGCSSLGNIYFWGRVGVARDHARAAAYLDKACRAGCGSDCDRLGDMLRNADEVPRDLARAAASYDRACALRFSPSCASLSELYRDGRGVPQDAVKSRRLLDRACTLSRNQVEQCHGR